MKSKIITSVEIIVSVLLVAASGFLGAVLAEAMQDYEGRVAIMTITFGMVCILIYLAIQVFPSNPTAKRSWVRPPVVRVDEMKRK